MSTHEALGRCVECEGWAEPELFRHVHPVSVQVSFDQLGGFEPGVRVVVDGEGVGVGVGGTDAKGNVDQAAPGG